MKHSPAWKALIADDDLFIHEIIEKALQNFEFDKKNIQLFHAFSGRDACDILCSNPDIEVVFVDLVMETIDAGFRVINYLRNFLENFETRIILMTGNISLAPEAETVLKYEINEYREKSNLSQSKIIASMCSALRSYRDISLARNTVDHESQKDRVLIDRSGLQAGQDDRMAYLLRNVISESRLLVHYQPIYNIRNKEIVGLEALVRLCGEDGSLIFPKSFIHIAEQTNLINILFRTALKQICVDVTRWASKGLRFPSIAVNISAYQFIDERLPNQLIEIMAEHGLSIGCIELELTESALLSDNAHVMHQLQRLRDLGLDLVIDDFGTGYSSLRYLSRFPVSKVKMDRCFTAEILTSSRTATIVDAIFSLGARLKLKVIAEGIETVEQESALISKGFLYGQGFLYSRATDAGNIEIILAAEKINLARAADNQSA